MIIDIILVALIVLSTAAGYARGFIRTLLGFVGVAAALIVATIFSPSLANYLDTNIVNDTVTNVIDESLTEAFDDGNGSLDQILGAVNKFVFSDGVDAEGYAKGIESGGSVEAVSRELASRISAPVCSAAAFIGIFILTVLVVKIISAVLDKLFKLPVLRQTNGFLGGLLGLALGVIYAMILSRAFVLMLPWLTSTVGGPFTPELASGSHLLVFFSGFNIIKTVISGVADLA